MTRPCVCLEPSIFEKVNQKYIRPKDPKGGQGEKVNIFSNTNSGLILFRKVFASGSFPFGLPCFWVEEVIWGGGEWIGKIGRAWDYGS
jgi:hypothetical protein